MKILAIFLLLAFAQGLRPPSVPLVVQDPYISIWSASDNLYDSFPQHWAGGIMALTGMILIDGQCFRFMGPKDMSGNVCPNNILQKSLEVTPTKTIYTFQQGQIQLVVSFTQPAIMTKIELLSLPLTYYRMEVTNMDSQPHNISLYYDNSAEVAVNQVSEKVDWTITKSNPNDGLNFLKMGTVSNQFNNASGSDRLNWGYWYVSTPVDNSTTVTGASDVSCRTNFAKGKDLPAFDYRKPRSANDEWPVLAIKFDLGKLQSKQSDYRYASLSYDQTYGMQYFGSLFIQNWKNNWKTMEKMLLNYMQTNIYKQLLQKIDQFDQQVQNDLKNSFKSQNSTHYQMYNQIGSLAYRQVTGGLQIVYNHVTNQVWTFMKEISSDGDVSTVDVIYPAAPLILYLNPELFYQLTLPIMEYANNETAKYGEDIRYSKIWSPHHLGHWPVCNLPSIKQEDMPIEETANMLILIDFIIQNDTTKLDAYSKWNNLIDQWGRYLASALPDPGEQLCTDDFEGPSPHNVNLAAKGIVGLGAYSDILKRRQDPNADYYLSIAKDFVQFWVDNSLDKDGKKYKLQYDLTYTWSQKYNIMFQYLLDLDLFDDSVIKMELEFYATQDLAYGTPLDNRALFTKADWLMWIASMGTDAQFIKIMNDIYNFLDITPNRVPFSDWYYAQNARQKGFQARPVVGGVWSKVLRSQHDQQKLQIKQ